MEATDGVLEVGPGDVCLVDGVEHPGPLTPGLFQPVWIQRHVV